MIGVARISMVAFVLAMMYAISGVYAEMMQVSSSVDMDSGTAEVSHDLNVDEEGVEVSNSVEVQANGSLLKNAKRYKYMSKEKNMKNLSYTQEMRVRQELRVARNFTLPKAIYQRLQLKVKNEEEFNRTLIKHFKKIEILQKNNWKFREIRKEAVKNYTVYLKVVKKMKNTWKQRLYYLRGYLYQFKSDMNQCAQENFQSDRCKSLKENYTARAVEYLETALNTTITVLQATKFKLEASPYVNESEVKNAIQEIDEKIKVLETLRDSLASRLDACEDLNCYKEAAREVREEIMDAKELVKNYLYMEKVRRADVIVTRAEVLLAQLERVQEKADEKNIDISQEVEQINDLIGEAYEYKEKAEEALNNKDYDAVGRYIAEANHRLNEAKKLLQKVWNKIVSSS